MTRIRVLVVDDSVVARRVISEVLNEDVDIEVAAVAANGRIALAKLAQVNPDLVLLDLDMPVMDGLTTLDEIRSSDAELPVLMFSAFTERGAEATLEALFRGATDYVTKPASMASAATAADAVRRELIPRIKVLCGRPSERAAAVRRHRDDRAQAAAKAETGIGAVAIAASTGGPNALQTVLHELPSRFPAPILIVQHMPEIFTRYLAHQLAAKCPLDVSEARSGDEVAPGRVYIAPGGLHMEVESTAGSVRIHTNKRPPVNSCRPSADVLFHSVAATYGPQAVGVVLTGMGRDGLRGSESIRARGGKVVVQDQASSVVWGMPGFVVEAGLADAVLNIGRIGVDLVDRVSRNSASAGPKDGGFP